MHTLVLKLDERAFRAFMRQLKVEGFPPSSSRSLKLRLLDHAERAISWLATLTR